MTQSYKTQYNEQLNDIAERYRSDGFEVVIEPQVNDIPFDLGSYHPDMLARKPQINLIIEVKSSADRLSFDQLRSVAETVRQHSGWHFILVTAQDIPSVELPGAETKFSWNDIAVRVKHAQDLNQAGSSEVAYILLWIALEQLLRLQARRIDLPVDRLPPSIVLRQLYSMGELTMEQFDTALACQKIRNRVVHGFSTSNLAESTSQLLTLVHELLTVWSTEDQRNP